MVKPLPTTETFSTVAKFFHPTYKMILTDKSTFMSHCVLTYVTPMIVTMLLEWHIPLNLEEGVKMSAVNICYSECIQLMSSVYSCSTKKTVSQVPPCASYRV